MRIGLLDPFAGVAGDMFVGALLDAGAKFKVVRDGLADIAPVSHRKVDRSGIAARKFRVGAAVLTNTGDVFSGCNVENASYGLTVCAERNAVFQMVANAQQQIQAIVIYTPTEDPATPCGACRQVINEFGPDARVISVCDGPERLETTLGKLLPNAFRPKIVE